MLDLTKKLIYIKSS